jgi:N-acetylglucosaminyl-diphospho-decaprenol L-rhamnosyltransferase
VPDSPVPPAAPVPLKVSALIVTRNQAEAARRTVAALEKSVPREMLEIIVADAGSQDGTTRLDEEFPHISVLRNARNFGWTKIANIGTRTARGEYLFLLYAGAEVDPQTVAKLAAHLEADPAAAAVVPLERDAAGATVSTFYPLPGPAELAARRSTGHWGTPLPLPAPGANVEFPAGAPVMIRRQAIVQINYFDDRYGQFGADLDVFHQVKRGGRKIVFLPEATVISSGRPPELAHGYQPADVAHGIARFVGKWQGFGTGLSTRVGGAFSRLSAADLGGFLGVLTGSKVDGTQKD